MVEIITFLKSNLADHFVILFIPLYILGGRPVAILSAQFLGYKVSFLLPTVVLLDTLQIPMFYYLYESVSKRAFFKRLSDRSQKKEKNLRKTKLFHWMQVIGMPGVVAITMVPMKGCGMWSGVLLSKLLGLSKQTSYPLLIIGSILGCAFLLGIGEAVLRLITIVANT
ncbi:MAG: small multi-drug export protein [Deltaproteobacteria bacterium]|nr:small multi-drug export protein [Deltaproteobacteria bacterium]